MATTVADAGARAAPRPVAAVGARVAGHPVVVAAVGRLPRRVARPAARVRRMAVAAGVTKRLWEMTDVMDMLEAFEAQKDYGNSN